jgi:hypothetical protein
MRIRYQGWKKVGCGINIPDPQHWQKTNKILNLLLKHSRSWNMAIQYMDPYSVNSWDVIATTVREVLVIFLLLINVA